jgi:hypothetical protein
LDGIPPREVWLMFERLFGKVSEVVYHKIAPYADERQHIRGG